MLPKTETTKPVHEQLMRKITPIIGVLAVLAAAVGIYLYQESKSSHLTQVHSSQLADYANQVSIPLQQAIGSAQELARGAATRVFANELRRVGADSVTSALNGQSEMQTNMQTLLGDSNRNYFAIRYIDLQGTVWTEVTNRSGILTANSRPQSQVLAGDNLFQKAVTSPQPLLSGVTMRQVSPGVVEPAIRIFVPVTANDAKTETLGLISLEILVRPIVTPINLADEGTGQRWVMVNRDGRYMADNASPRAYLNSLSTTSPVTLAKTEPELAALLQAQGNQIYLAGMDSGVVSSRQITVGNAEDMPWTLIVIDHSGYTLINMFAGIGGILLACVAAAGGTIFALRRILRHQLEPLSAVSVMVEQMAAGTLASTEAVVLPDDIKNGHELEAVKRVATRLQDLTEENEDLATRHSHNLEIANRVSQETAAITDLDTLVNRTIDLICSEYGFYHAQVFLMDDVGLNAILVYSRGLIGQRLLEQQLMVSANELSVVGATVRTGHVTIANNLHDASSPFDRMLPDTRAQMALPLFVNNRMIGVLDIHSIVANVLHEEEAHVFQLLANQLAGAIANARVLAESQQRNEQITTLNKQLTRAAWDEVQEQAGLDKAYRYNLIAVEAAPAEVVSSASSDITASLSIRGEVIGTIAATAAQNQPFTQGDYMVLQAVAERVSLVIEGARLFKETQNVLATTSLLYQLSRFLNEANTLEDIVKAIVEATMSDASGGQIWLFDEYPMGTVPEWLEIITDWSGLDRAGQSRAHLRLHVSDSQFLMTMQDNNVRLVQDMALDQRLDSNLRQMFLAWGTRAAVFIPYSVRGFWRGIITMEFPRPRDFTEREGRIYTALIDQAGVAIDNRLLFRQTELTLDQIERLYAASRIINSAQALTDLIHAAATATKNPDALDFELGLLEGQLDGTGWPTRIRKVARRKYGQQVYEEDDYETFIVPLTSPLRQRIFHMTEDTDSVSPHVIMFPLFSANQPIAVFFLRSMTPIELTEDDHEVYQALTGQMSTMLENRRLLEQTASALDETRRLYAASRSIAGAPDLQAVYEAAIEHLTQSADQVSNIQILLAGPNPGPDAAYFDFVHVWERIPNPNAYARVGLRVDARMTPLMPLAQPGTEPLYFGDLSIDIADEGLRELLKGTNIASGAVISLRTQRTWFGVLMVECETVHGFDEQYIRFARAVTNQIAIAVENRLLFEQARQEAQRALALAEAGQLAAKLGTDFETSLNEIFSRVAQAAGYDRWLVMFRSEDDPDLLQRVVRQTPDLEDANTADFSLNLQTDQHPIADAIRTQRTLLVNSLASYPGLRALDEETRQRIGKRIAAPIFSGGQMVGGLSIGRGLQTADLDENDEQVITTLAAQVGVALENRRLLQSVEAERQYLRSVLESMPTGILVLDAQTFKPLQSNAQVESLLRKAIDFTKPFNAADYSLYRTGTSVHYPVDELPVFVAAASGHQDFSDDIAVIFEDGTHTDLLLNAAPIRDARGHVVTIVTAFQDISNLRSLENALQDNLRETIALYEVTRSLSEASELDGVLDIVLMQLIMLESTEGYIVLLDENTNGLKVVRAVTDPEAFNLPTTAFDLEQLFISDSSQYASINPELAETLQNLGVMSLASVPLRARDMVMGWIVVTYDHLHHFTTEDERFLTTLSDGSAVAIDNRNLFVSTQQSYQEATTLYETSRALANASTPDDVVQAIVQHMNRDHVTYVFMAVPPAYERGDVPNALQVAAYWQREGSLGMNLIGVTLSADQFPAWRLVASQTLLTIDDTADPSLDDLERIGLESMDTHALAVLPLRAGRQSIGSLWIGCSEPYRHTERDLRIYQSFTEQASLSMQATRLLDQAERRARQLATSAEVSRIASAILDINALLPQLVNLIKDAFHYDHVQVFLMDANDTYAELRASTGEAGAQLLEIKHKLEKGSRSVIGQVTSTGQPALALDTADARFVHKPNPYLPLTRSEMALPLVVKNRVVGALDVQSNQPNAFTEEDLNLLSALSAQISIAIDNASLFAQSERRARDMGFLFTVTSAAALPDQSLHESLQNVAELVLSELNTLTVSIYMIEKYVSEESEEIEIIRPIALAGSDQPLSEIAEVLVSDTSNLLGEVVKTHEPVLIEDILNESRYLPITEAAHSAIVVPMAAGPQIIGLIAIEDNRPGAYNEETLTLLRTLNTTLSAIVQNAALLDQVRKQNDQLRELDKLKSDFLANMSHELRTPLNSIIGFSRVILKGIDGPLTEMQEQDLTTIYNSGQHLLGLINDILDQAKINSGKMDLQKDYFDVKPVVEGVRSIGIGLVKEKPVDIRLDIASGLPKCFGDEFRTRQVLINLVSNAAKFTQQGSITIRVETDQDPETQQAMVRVDVVDTGIGIAEKDLPLLFEAFRQVDSSLTRTVGGTGLGLPISKSLVEMQGGRMVVRSEINVGSTFSIYIPLEPTNPVTDSDPIGQKDKKPTGPISSTNGQSNLPKQTGALTEALETVETPNPRDKRTTAQMSGFMQTSKRQILLVEDNPDMVDQYRRALQREGFDIFAASIPLEAEAMASGLRPTIIIMDVNFANGAGWDIMGRLRQRDDTRDIPLIICTLSEEEERAKEMGAFCFIRRPFTPDQIVKAVKEAEQDSQTERILIIDDQPDSTRLIKETLNQYGHYRIFEAPGGSEGVSMVARHRPNLIILDLRMPEMDGFAVLEELQANPETAAIPILVVTADTLDAGEKDRLAEMTVLYKADLSRENYVQLIAGIKAFLAR